MSCLTSEPGPLHLPQLLLTFTSTGCQGLEECHQWLSRVFWFGDVAKDCGDPFLGLGEGRACVAP